MNINRTRRQRVDFTRTLPAFSVKKTITNKQKLTYYFWLGPATRFLVLSRYL